VVIIQILVNKAKLFSLSRARIWLFAMGLVLATIFAYRPAWNGSFVCDDDFRYAKPGRICNQLWVSKLWDDGTTEVKTDV
jgi:hypothetical protein